MNTCALIAILCLASVVTALPVHNAMVMYHMPYYSPYNNAMLVHYAPLANGRSKGSSVFAAGDSIAAGTSVNEHHAYSEQASRAVVEQSARDGNVEAIAEAYPEEPIQGAVQFDQGEEQYNNEVIPLNAAPVSEPPQEEEPQHEQEVPAVVAEEPQVQEVQPQVVPTTVAPKKKVHIALDIPDSAPAPAPAPAHDETEGDEEDDEYPYAPQKPSKKNGGSPTYTFFPISFGRASGGTIAVANAYSTGGRGAVRSHAIAYGGGNAATRRQPAVERVNAAQKSA